MESSFTVPTILNRTKIPQAAILNVVDQIIALIQPKNIVLFGLYAYGTPRPESDVDLLVVVDSQKSSLVQSADICKKLNYRFGLDLVVYSSQDLAQRLEWGDLFLREITRRGITLYEPSHT